MSRDRRTAIAVIANSTWIALKARRALRISWSDGNSGEDSERCSSECRQLAALAPERIVRNDGDVDRAFAGAAHRLEAVYPVALGCARADGAHELCGRCAAAIVAKCGLRRKTPPERATWQPASAKFR